MTASNVTTIETALCHAAQTVAPSFSVRPEHGFFPMLDIDRGDFSSGIAIAIAAEQRTSATALADRFIENLQKEYRDTLPEGSPGIEWRNDAGYLVVRGAPEALWGSASGAIEHYQEICQARPFGPLPQTVVLLTPDRAVPLYARLRLVAVSAFHAWLLVRARGMCRLVIDPLPGVIVSSWDEIMMVLRDATHQTVERNAIHQPAVSDSIQGTILDGDGPVLVWSAHHYVDRFPKESKSWLHSIRKDPRVTVRMPSDGWLLSRDRALPELLGVESLKKVLPPSTASGAEASGLWFAWMMHAAGAAPSGDFDPAVFRFDERANLAWSLRALKERWDNSIHGKLIKVSKAGIQEEAATLLNGMAAKGEKLLFSRGPDRALWLRGCFMAPWIERARIYGDISPLMTVLEEFGILGHAALNSPGMRIEMDSGALSPLSHQIAASVGFGLSSILPIVSEESCVDR